jgi:hypothetical protein
MVDAVPNESVPARLRTWALAVCRYVGSAPLTYGWLTVLLFTMIIQHELTRRQLHTLLVHESTNLRHLATDPLRVLASSHVNRHPWCNPEQEAEGLAISPKFAFREFWLRPSVSRGR